MTIKKPMPIRSRPIPTVQRRSKPVKGSVLAFVLFVVVGTLLFVAGATSFAGAFAGALFSFDGDVPALGGVWL